MGDEGSSASGTTQVPDLERATFQGTTTGGVCEVCREPLPGEYFQVDGRVLCPSCRTKVIASDASGLSARERFIMAWVYGAAAALAGSIVWYVVARVTGMELGIIAIGVGLLVGIAVRKGSRGRGGRGYQALAVILTYLSIVTSYVPMVITGIKDAAAKAANSDATGASAGDGHTAAGSGVSNEGNSDTTKSGGKAGTSAPGESKPSPLVAVLMLAGWVLGIAIAAPFLGGGNIMGLLIIGIALWEAWKINRRVEPKVLGPFHLAPTTRVGPAPPTAL